MKDPNMTEPPLTNLTGLPSCPIFPEHPVQCTVIINVRRVIASISLVGCVFMILVIWLFRKYIAFAQRLILYLSIAAMFDCIAFLMLVHLSPSDMIVFQCIAILLGELHPDGLVCDFQAWWMTFFDWSVLLWVCCITVNLFFSVVRGVTSDKYEWLYHAVSWGISLIMSLIPFIGDQYGPAGGWCWIKDTSGWQWRVGIWYGPLFVIIVILFVVYVYISCVLSKKVHRWEGTYDPDTEREKQMLKDDIKPLRAYPFVYLAATFFPLINRIQNATDVNHPVFALVLLASISAPLHGFLNAIVFGLDRETRRRLTPSQIKVAFYNKFGPKAEIREYTEDLNQRGDPEY